MHERARGVSPCGIHRCQLWSGVRICLERTVADARESRRGGPGCCSDPRWRHLTLSLKSRLFIGAGGPRPFRFRRLFAIGRLRLEIPPYGWNSVLLLTFEPRKEELREHAIENRRLVSCATEDRAKGVANCGLACEGHDLERSRGIVTFASAYPESMFASKDVAERDQIVGKARKRVHRQTLTTPRRHRSDP